MYRAEVLVVGAGVIGSSIAYHLARQGRQVLVLDRADVSAEPSASWASAGGVRRQGRHKAELLLAIESDARWPTLEEELGADLHYRQWGNLLLAENDAEADRLAAFVRAQHRKGLTDVRLVDRAECREIVPGIGEQIVAGSYSPADGQADPALTTRAFASAAQRHGAMYWTQTACHALLADDSRVSGAITSRGEIAAETTILAAGAWSDELATTVGMHLPIVTRALQMVRSTAAPSSRAIPVLSALSRALSLKQLHDGAFLLGGGWPGDISADRRGYTLRNESIEGNWKAACAIVPAVAAQRVERAWCGLEAISSDEIPFIGAVPGIVGLSVATGFSGHGFAIAPAVGRAVADQLAGKSVPELEGVRPERIIQISGRST